MAEQKQSSASAGSQWQIPDSYQRQLLEWLKIRIDAAAAGQVATSMVAETIRNTWVEALKDTARVVEAQHASHYRCVRLNGRDDDGLPDDDLGWECCGPPW